MSGFLDELTGVNFTQISDQIGRTTPQAVESCLLALGRGENAPPGALAVLVSPAAAAFLEPMARLARNLTLRRFGKIIQLYAPLYISNYCTNHCVYCGFNASHPVPRRTLSFGEVLSEARILQNRRIRQLLLVSGESPDQVPVEFLEELARALKPGFPSLAVEIYPLNEDGYRRLAAAGVDSLTIYQETYNPALYAEVHPRGPKRDFKFRLGAPERGAAAGFRQVSIGALLGLDRWQPEAVCLARHARYLMKHHWRAQVSLSFPRLRPAAGGYQPLFPVSDRELVQLILAMRLVLPEAGINLSTREPAAFRDHLLGLGVTRISAGSRTSPGGYSDEGHPAAESQFDVHDRRTVEEVVAMIRAQGFDPVWKDWDPAFEAEPRGST